MSIPLPPLPSDNIAVMTIERVRARDQEIVRCVLEAAAKMCRDAESGLWKVYKQGDGALKKGRGSEYVQGAADQSALLADAVVNLEFHHAE